MNGQVNYIASAFLLLSLTAGTFLFVSKLPSSIFEDKTEQWCATVEITPGPVLSARALQGKTLFMQKCASCHALHKHATGPGLFGFEERGPWSVRQNVYDWIRNPAAFMERNPYAAALKTEYGSMMTAFPELTNEEIDMICDYIREAEQIKYGVPVAK